MFKTEYQKNAFNFEVKSQSNRLYERTKCQTIAIEQQATSINPRMIIGQKKPDQLFMEVRARKLRELQDYKSRSEQDKVKDILSLLQQMKGRRAEKDEEDTEQAILNQKMSSVP